MQIMRTTAKLPPIIVVHGLPGIGKTTFAQNFPVQCLCKPRTDARLDWRLPPWGLRESFTGVIDAMRHLGKASHDYKTMVLDSLDKLEPLVLAAVCADRGYANREPRLRQGLGEADQVVARLAARVSGCAALAA